MFIKHLRLYYSLFMPYSSIHIYQFLWSYFSFPSRTVYDPWNPFLCDRWAFFSELPRISACCDKFSVSFLYDIVIPLFLKWVSSAYRILIWQFLFLFHRVLFNTWEYHATAFRPLFLRALAGVAQWVGCCPTKQRLLFLLLRVNLNVASLKMILIF